MYKLVAKYNAKPLDKYIEVWYTGRSLANMGENMNENCPECGTFIGYDSEDKRPVECPECGAVCKWNKDEDKFVSIAWAEEYHGPLARG